MRSIQKLACVLLLFISSYSFAQTGVTVTYYDGTVQIFNVAPTGKLSFAEDNLLVQLTDVGTATTIPVTIIRKITFSDTSSTLAVQLARFTALANTCSATVNWESGSEENFSHYELQYGTSSGSFTKFVLVNSKGSNQLYSINLPNLNGRFYYRLKMVDKNGSIKYSNILSNQISCSGAAYASVYPNPAADMIRIKTNNTDNLNMKIYSATGQLVLQGSYQQNSDINIAKLASGLYLVQVNGFNIKFYKK